MINLTNTQQASIPAIAPRYDRLTSEILMHKTFVVLVSDGMLLLLGVASQFLFLNTEAKWAAFLFGGFALGWIFCSIVLFIFVSDYDAVKKQADEAERLKKQNRKLRRRLCFSFPLQDENFNLVDEDGRLICPICWRDRKEIRLPPSLQCPVCFTQIEPKRH